MKFAVALAVACGAANAVEAQWGGLGGIGGGLGGLGGIGGGIGGLGGVGAMGGNLGGLGGVGGLGGLGGIGGGIGGLGGVGGLGGLGGVNALGGNLNGVGSYGGYGGYGGYGAFQQPKVSGFHGMVGNAHVDAYTAQTPNSIYSEEVVSAPGQNQYSTSFAKQEEHRDHDGKGHFVSSKNASSSSMSSSSYGQTNYNDGRSIHAFQNNGQDMLNNIQGSVGPLAFNQGIADPTQVGLGKSTLNDITHSTATRTKGLGAFTNGMGSLSGVSSLGKFGSLRQTGGTSLNMGGMNAGMASIDQMGLT